MDQHNPYAAPQVELVEARVPPQLPGWSAGQLRVLGWLSLATALATGAALVAAFLSASEQAAAAARVGEWLGTLSTLLGCYLLLRFKAFLEQRFAAGKLAAPVYLIVLSSLLSEGLHWVWGDAIFARLDWPTLSYFGLLALMGLATLWLGIVLLKVRDPYPVLRVMAWLEVVGGIMAASVILIVLAFVPLLAGTVASALVFFRGARELEGQGNA